MLTSCTRGRRQRNPSRHGRVLEQDAPHLLDGLGMRLRGVPERTTSSEATPSMCALSYFTTPSAPSSGGPSPCTAMIGCAATHGATGSEASVWRKGSPGVMLSMLLGARSKLRLSLRSSFRATRSTAALVASLGRDEAELLAFFDFPAEHWVHLRTANVIESPFATVRLRQRVTKAAGPRQKGLLMAFKLLAMAERRWRRVNAPQLVPLVRAGVFFADGIAVERGARRAA